MFKILISIIFLMGNAYGEFTISNIKLTPTELELVGDSLEDIKSVTIISKDSSKEFEIENLSSNQVIARSLDTTMVEGLTLNLVISDSLNESTYPITISQKNGLVTFYKMQEKESDYKPVVNSQNKMVLDQINFSPGDNNTGYDYNYSIYGNPTGDFAIKGADKDLFTIDNEGNVEISGTLKIKGKQVGFNIPYLPIKEQTIPSNSANKVVFSAGQSKELVESGYTIPMNICPKGQILKSDGINFVCSLEASQEEQLGPVYSNQKSNFGIDQIYRELQINNLVIDSSGNITGALNFTSLGIMDVATATFHVTPGTGVGIGIAAPTVKLDILGANNSGIKLKQNAKIGALSTTFSNGMVFEDPSSTKAVGIGYGAVGASDTFSIISFDTSIYNTVFSIDGTGNGIVLGNLKIGAYTLPAAAGASGTVLTSVGGGTVSWGTVGGGTVNGPGTTAIGSIASWGNTNGTLLADGGKPVANLVTNAGAGTPGFVAKFGASGTIIQDGTNLEANLVTASAPASNTNNLASFSAAGQRGIKDSGILSTDVMTMAGPPPVVIGGNILASIGGTKSATESTVPIANLVTMAVLPTATNQVLLTSGATKQTVATSYSFPTAGGSPGQVLAITATGTANWATVGGGDVTGPAGGTALNEVAVFTDASGKTIKGASLSALNIVTKLADFPVANRVALSSGNNRTLTESPYTFPTINGSANQVLKTDGAGAATWQDPSVGTSTVQNFGAGIDNGIPRFNGGGGKEIQSSLVTISDTGDLLGVTTINGKTPVDFVTMASTPTADDRIFLSTNGSKVAKITDYTMPALKCPDGNILKFTTGNLACTVDTSGVTMFNGRTGIVTPTTGDYTASMVTSTPAGAIAASTTQGALNELDTEKLALAGGTMTGTLIITPAVQPAITLNPFGAAASELRFVEGGGTEYVGFKAPANAAANAIWILPDVVGASGTVLSNEGGGVLSWKATSGGDVTGPAGSASGTLATFSGTSGKIIQDSGVVAANLVSGPATATPSGIAIFNGGTGKIIQSSVVSINASGDLSGVGDISSTGDFTVTGNLNVTGAGTFSLGVTAQSYTNTSDRKLKKDITPFSGGDLIDKLMPVTFRWKKGDDRPVIGLIAQDVEKVLPDVITITKTKDGSIRSYDVGQVLALTIEALKETRAEVKKLQEKIKKLEQKKR